MQVMQTKKIYRKHIITDQSIVVVFDYGPPVIITSNNDRYDNVRVLLEQRRFSEVPDAVDKAMALRIATKGKFSVLNGAVVIDGAILPKALSSRLVEMVDSGEDTVRLENFWDNLAQNPTDSSRQDLYDFLVANDVPITQDGCFIVYKKVKGDFWDSHTGKTFHCTPGAVISMNRDEVDHDRTHTCSAGLHVAAWEYAHNFSGSRIVECKVNPRDVVAVPPDYSQQKMRVCRAEIVRETESKYGASPATYDLDESDGKIVDNTLGTVVISPDSEGRVRIPGKLVRRLGVGVGYQVEVVLEDDGDDFLTVRAIEENEDCEDAAWALYTIQSDNSIRISPEILDWAYLSGEDVEVTESSDSLHIRLA